MNQLVVPASAGFTLAPVRPEDFDALAALRLRAMRESLERLGRYDEQRSRERLAASFDPARTRHIVAGGERVGFLVLKTLSHTMRLDHFYIDTPWQNHGLGHRVAQWLCDEADRLQRPIELTALKRSAANRFYQRHGFAAVGEGEWDIDYLRPPITPHMRVVRDLWHAFQARDWAAARALLRDDLQARWWTSGERFETADAFIDAQARYPEGWTIHLIECQRLEGGRVMTLVRVTHPPQVFYATSFFQVDEGRVIAIDEVWATAEAPPDWRAPEAFPGIVRFDANDDPRAVLP